VFGDADHRNNLITSIYLAEPDLEAHDEHIIEKYAVIQENEQRASLFKTDGAEILVIACNTPARMAQGAVDRLRSEGVPVGLFRPLTLWPFPIFSLAQLLEHCTSIVVVEASAGQLEDEVRLAMSHAGCEGIPIHHLRRMGGILPQESEIIDIIRSVAEVSK
jgi:pyruvate/2-oxoacid:ferredoxin oxidoreductase alpha subunit